MRYNYYYLCLHVLFLLGLVTSCSNDIDYTYKGSNYIQISTADDPAIAENDDRPVTVDVLLATAVETDATIHFELSGNEDGVLNMENDGSVLIKAGEKKASFKIASNHKSLLNTQKVLILKVKDFTDSRMRVWNELKLIAKPSPTLPELTEEQIELIEGYRERYGVNLNRFIGEVKCHVTVIYPTDDIGTFYDEETRSFEGKSVITLSDNATAERPILKMIDNPLGLTSFLWEILKKETIEDDEVWMEQPYNQAMVKAINFSEDEEEFKVLLDNIELEPEAQSISFVTTVQDVNGYDLKNVPFEYSFTAWDRWKTMGEQGKTVSVLEGDNWVEYSVTELITEYAITLDPIAYLLYSSIDEDGWENEPSDFIEPKGSFNEDTFTFQFPWDHYNSGGYTQIYVTYTLNK